MSDLIVRENNLPTTMEDLSKFVLFGDEAVNILRAQIAALKKCGAAKDVVELQLKQAQTTAENVTIAKIKLGELLAVLPKATKNNNLNGRASKENNQIEAPVDLVPNETAPKVKPKAEAIKELGISQKQSEQLQQMAKNPDAVHAAMAKARENDDVVSQAQIIKEIKQSRHAEKEKSLAEAKAEIAAQTVDQREKPILFVDNGIGFKPDEPYKLLLTDPPYSTDVDNVAAFAESWLPNALNHVRRDGFAYVFIGAYPDELKAYLNISTPEHIQLIQVLVWTYRNTLGNNPRDRYKQNWQACLFYRGVDAPPLDCPITNEQWAVQDINAPDGRLGNRYHTWQKPDEIAERFIRHSTRAGDTVFDPFACTGTFLLAAAKLGRKAYGFEINEQNANIAFERGCQRGGNV